MSGNKGGGGIDRRAARTRRLLHQALMELVIRKDYESITVQDLLDEADVGRSTFYAHYAGKDELLRRGFEQLRAELQASIADGKSSDSSPPLAFSLAMFAHADRYRMMYRALVGSRGNAIVLAEIRHVLLELLQPELELIADEELPRELTGRYLVDAFQSVLTWWLERRPDLTPVSVDVLFRRLVVPSAAFAPQSPDYRRVQK